MSAVDLLVIGAGISGLSLAHYAACSGARVQVLEQQPRAGGCLHTHRFSGALDGFWLELGAHSAFNSYANLLDILAHHDLIDRLQPRQKVSFRLFADNTAHSIVSQLCWTELLQAPFRFIGARKENRSVADYFRPIVGARNYANVFDPAFSAVLSQPAGDFPAECLFRKRTRRKGVPRGFTLPNGLQTIADVLSQRAAVNITLGCTVRGLQREGQTFIAHTDHGDYPAHAIAIATPVAVAATLLQEIAPESAAQLAGIRTAPITSMGVAAPRALLKLPPVAGLIARDAAFYSAVSRDTVTHPTYRGFTFHFRPNVWDEQGMRERVGAVLGLPDTITDNPDHTVFCTHTLPALRVGDANTLRRVDQALIGQRIALTGNYFTGVALEDCVTRSLEEWQRLQQEGMR